VPAPPAAVEPALPGGLDAALVLVPVSDVEAALAAIPASAGVGQFLAEAGRNLLIGRAANLRRWAATHLGAGPPPRPGRRPPLDLRPVAAEFRYASSAGEFQQRLLFERLMARYVPISSRRDLKPPAWVHLDAEEPFPRLTTRGGRGARAGGPLFGPFRDSRAAARARDAVHRRLPLRPCDFTFEPHPDLPLGLRCVHAQTRTCAAPCLGRMTPADYRALARSAMELLRGPRDDQADLPSWVSARGAPALVVDPTRHGIELYPVRGGRVLEACALRCAAGHLEEAVAALSWPEPEGDEDWPWLLSWLHAPKRKGRFLALPEPDTKGLSSRLLDVLR
jgi:hypothetical protein